MTPTPLLNHRYNIIKALAEGGFGKTFLAEDTQMPSRRKCVIKQLKPVSARPAIAQIVKERFTREAAVLDTVGKRHAQIPSLYDYFVVSGQYYLVQEWIEGTPLQVAEHIRWSEDRVRQLLKQLLPAIAHIHSLNVIHRDIKPDNIILRTADQLPCLIDFGAVKEVMTTIISPAGSPKSSIVIGTAGYMPPEQAAGHPTFSSDLYSLGMTAIGLLTGKSPAALPSDSHTGQLLWQQFAPKVSTNLAQILSLAIHPLPQHRYLTAENMLEALQSQTIPSQAIGLTQAPPNLLPTNTFPTTASLPTAPPSTTTASPQVLPQSSNQKKSTLTQLTSSPVAIIAIAATTCILGAALVLRINPQLNFSSAANTANTANTATGTNSSLSPQTNTTVPQTGPQTELKAEPQTASDWLSNAIVLYKQGRNQQALEAVDTALSLNLDNPDTITALSLRGDILVNQSRIDLPGAIAAYSQALTLEPNNADLLNKRCEAYKDNQDWALAHQDCTQLLSLSSNNADINADINQADIYDRRGDIRFAQENYSGAIEDYSQAIAINEKAGNAIANQSIYFSRSHAYNGIGEPGKALEDLEKFRQTQ